MLSSKKILLTQEMIILFKKSGPASFFFYLLLIEGLLFYNIVLVSAIHQLISTIGIHMSPPSTLISDSHLGLYEASVGNSLHQGPGAFPRGMLQYKRVD